MKRIPIGSKVKISGVSPQWPYERISDEGFVEDNNKGYLVSLIRNRERMFFPRKFLSIIVDKP